MKKLILLLLLTFMFLCCTEKEISIEEARPIPHYIRIDAAIANGDTVRSVVDTLK